MKRQIVIIGAGAIGRGYLPWIFDSSLYEFVFVDANPRIIELMNSRKKYSTHRVRGDRYESREIAVQSAFLPKEAGQINWSQVAAAFVNVGPRNISAVAPIVEGATCPIILCENDPACVQTLQALTTNQQIYFAVPDVITSNTAPGSLLASDPLAVATEDGILFVDDRLVGIQGDFQTIPEGELLAKQWTAKLYLHNTPHCVAAYLGAVAKVEYVHQAMAIPRISLIVQGAMEEMLNSLKLQWELPHPFLEWYAQKELSRFSCPLLFDPISRVAREPLRKLEVDGRLIGAAQICIAQGFVPQNILVGIGSALLFDDPLDSDQHLKFMRKALTPASLLTHVLSLRKGEALEMVLEQRMGGIIETLEGVAQ